MAPPGIGGSVEGVHAVAAAVAAGRVEHLLVERSRIDSLSELIEDARRRGASIEVVEDVSHRAETSAPQGVLARCAGIPLRTLDDVVAATDPAAVVVLDHLEDPRNVGAVARSAAAAGMGGLVVARRRSAPLGATAFKAAAGAFETLPVAEVSAIPAALRRLSSAGVWTVGLDASSATSLFGLAVLAEPVALVLGGEGRGLARLAAERCDVVASIPMHGSVESLNASSAASLAVFEVARMRTGVRR